MENKIRKIFSGLYKHREVPVTVEWAATLTELFWSVVELFLFFSLVSHILHGEEFIPVHELAMWLACFTLRGAFKVTWSAPSAIDKCGIGLAVAMYLLGGYCVETNASPLYFAAGLLVLRAGYTSVGLVGFFTELNEKVEDILTFKI